MVIDTSAIVAILFDEPDQRRYGEAIEAATVRLVSAVTRVKGDDFSRTDIQPALPPVA